MVTTVGTESTAEKLIENCLILEHDAIAAYDAVIERLDNPSHRTQIESFKQDHLRHVDKLTSYAHEMGVTPPSEGDMKEVLTTGKVKMAGIAGDGAILKAMSTNETDTVAAYKNVSENSELPAQMRGMVEEALADERRHKAWMEQAAETA